MNSKFKLTVLSTLLTMASLGNYAQASVSLPTALTATINIGAELMAPVPTFVGSTSLGTRTPADQEIGAFSYTNNNPVAARLVFDMTGESIVGKSNQGYLHNKDLGDRFTFYFSSTNGTSKLNGFNTKLLEPNEAVSIKLLALGTNQVRPGVYTLTANASMWN